MFKNCFNTKHGLSPYTVYETIFENANFRLFKRMTLNVYMLSQQNCGRIWTCLSANNTSLYCISLTSFDLSRGVIAAINVPT